MNEQEMREEIERLRRELAEVRADRNSLHKIVCSMIPVEEMDMTPEQFETIKNAARPVSEVLRDLLPPTLHHLISDGNGRT
ncbi:MAG: hypothetical protein HYX68_24480 [Planctomycetes bacterium]|jgi:hypothetical protein|nr:hypothetical protein [Planctomycetota bacterium]